MGRNQARWGATACALLLIVCPFGAPPSAIRQSAIRPSAASLSAASGSVPSSPPRITAISGDEPLYELAGTGPISTAIETSFAHEALVLRRLACNYLANRGLSGTALSDIASLDSASLDSASLDSALSDPSSQLLRRLLAPPRISEAGATTALAEDVPAVHLATEDLAGRRLETALSRQMGSLILDDLCGEPHVTPSTTIPELHQKTDYWTAFSEGWAAHFQAVAYDRSGFPEEARRDLDYSLAALRYWSRRMAKEDSRPGAATLLFPIWHSGHKWAAGVEGTRSGAFARAPYGSPAEMLATPGAVSSLIYALVTDPRVQSSYREPSFYAMFLHPSVRASVNSSLNGADGNAQVAGWSPAQIFTPLENAYMKVFYVLASSVRPDPILTRPSPTLTLIAQYVKEFPDEKEAVYDALLWATGGGIFAPDAAGRLSVVGRTATPHEREQEARFIERLRHALLKGEESIDEIDRPQIWLLNTKRTQGLCIYDGSRTVPTPYSFDLNTATAGDLVTIPGITPGMAAEILSARRTARGFSTIRDLAQVRTITPRALNEIHSMKASMDRAMEAGGPLEGIAVSLKPVAASYLTRIALRLLTAFVACFGALVIVDGVCRRIQRHYLGGWAPPSWMDTHRGAWWRSFAAFFKVTGGMAALGALFLLLPPIGPLMRLAAGAGIGSVIWLCGALPQILGISGFAGLHRRYVNFRAGWSLTRLVVIASVAFLTI